MNLESNLFKKKSREKKDKIVKNQLFPQYTHLSIKLELVIGTIWKGIKSTILMHILIFDISFIRIKLRIISYFRWFLAYFLTFYPPNPKRLNDQSANMAHFVAFFISFQKIIRLNHPSPLGVLLQLVAQGLFVGVTIFVVHYYIVITYMHVVLSSFLMLITRKFKLRQNYTIPQIYRHIHITIKRRKLTFWLFTLVNNLPAGWILFNIVNFWYFCKGLLSENSWKLSINYLFEDPDFQITGV